MNDVQFKLNTLITYQLVKKIPISLCKEIFNFYILLLKWNDSIKKLILYKRVTETKFLIKLVKITYCPIWEKPRIEG